LNLLTTGAAQVTLYCTWRPLDHMGRSTETRTNIRNLA